ncbi:MAG: hypothetical protein EA412_02785 [Chitinophagaceae bacterium]|nr:MAG: hypothetical protein EA412_02785 [Chitinophagaceae bacterium]
MTLNITDIASLKFHFDDVLESTAEKNYRKERIYISIIMANTQNRKSTIIFATSDNQVNTISSLIKGFVNDNIIIEGGCEIPLKAIFEVSLDN